MNKNLSTKVARHVSAKLPAETRTEGWLAMSADIAWALWYTPSREQQPVEADAPKADWDKHCDEYRARVRRVLRDLVEEGYTFRQYAERPPRLVKSEIWHEATARMAWRLWLSHRRSSHPKDEEQEQTLWRDEADAYRAYVRIVVQRLHHFWIVFPANRSAG